MGPSEICPKKTNFFSKWSIMTSNLKVLNLGVFLVVYLALIRP